MEGRAKKVEGNVDYPINQGRHSARCEAGLQALYHPDRIRGPLVRVGGRGSGQFEEISWTDAIDRLTYQLELLQADGNESKMVLATDPVRAHLGLIVDRFVSRYGGRHMTYEALERTNLRAAIEHVFEQDTMPDFDIENAGYILSFGADFLNTWVSPVRYARGYGEFRQGDRDRGTLVHVDSRFSMTAANADEWVYVNPGWEGVLALSIAHVMASDGLGDARALDALTGGGAVDLDAYDPASVSRDVGVDADRIRRLAHDFAEHGPALAIGGGSAAAHTNGLFNLIAIYSLNHLAGSVGSPGGVNFNPPPPLDDISSTPATSSFEEWQRLAGDMSGGDVQMLMVRGVDPMYGVPGGAGIKDALSQVPFIFSFSRLMDDTTAMSDLILPEHDYLEDWGSDVPEAGPGYELVGFQQPVVRPFFEGRGEHLGTRGFADVLLTVSQKLGLDLGVPGQTFKEVLEDGAGKLFDLGRGSVRAADFRSFWNGVLQRGGWWDVSARASGSIPLPRRIPDRETPKFTEASGDEVFHLVPFASTSLGDGSGAPLPWLQATPDPVTTATWRTWVEINYKKAEELGIGEGDIVTIASAYGSIEALAFPHPGMPPGVVSVPVGQGKTAGGRFAQGRGGNILSMLAPSIDSNTGALAWASTRVSVEKTGRWMRLPKLENTVPDLPVDEHHEIVQITKTDS
jgi:anaerobic selenocysteine-containing dehydrogenase